MSDTAPRLGGHLTVKDYLEACSESSKRGRTAVVLLVVTSVLILAGLMNSLDSRWMVERGQMLASPTPEAAAQVEAYMTRRIGPRPRALTEPASPEARAAHAVETERYERRYAMVLGEYVHTDVQNAYTIRVPFFGVTFDVNDLGFIGGFALFCLLVLLAFALTREHENLLLAFGAVKGSAEAPTFYHLLAMSQVFTTPATQHNQSEKARTISLGAARLAPMAACVLPLAVQVAVVWHDMLTLDVGSAISPGHTRLVMIFEFCMVMGILWLTVIVIKTLWSSNRLWDAHYEEEVKKPKT